MDFENCSKTLKDNIPLMTKFQGKSRKQEMEFLRLKINLIFFVYPLNLFCSELFGVKKVCCGTHSSGAGGAAHSRVQCSLIFNIMILFNGIFFMKTF